ncbi:YdcF family protein [uncultured Alsobacter sp.]|uniref:YdcF family protein n=1 Tax=uncultured Alsobacter sp. TaxID=1748258 RepID=UPI0025F12795|nr:YdcF family protein [uncultured Alsobacter sp.]
MSENNQRPLSGPPLSKALERVWDYMRLTHEPLPSDAILVLGSFDVEAASAAARLWHEKIAPVLIMSGGVAHVGGLLETGWDRSEAEVFADRAMAMGVPRDAILIEDKAQNTGQNFSLGRQVAEAAGIRPKRLTVVAKPYMTRRGFATGRRVWPEPELRMHCEDIGVHAYLAREADPRRTILAMVGDLHRIMVYPSLGFSVPQDVPADVVRAMRMLVDAGYGERLLQGHPLPEAE